MKPRFFLDAIGDGVALSLHAKSLAKQYSELPNYQQLKPVSKEHGINTATLVQHHCLLAHQQHGQFIKEVNAASTSVEKAANLPELFIVPGLFYQKYSSLGADAKLLVDVAKRFGVACTLVPTLSGGGIKQNSELLQRYLQDNATKPYWLAAVSRGAAEVKWMLNQYPQAEHLKHLCGWVNLNGIVDGSPVVERAKQNGLSRFYIRNAARLSGINPNLVDELNQNNDAWLPNQLPSHVKYVNVISMPLSWDVCAPVQARYKRLSKHGPNDGVVLLCDYWREHGLCYPVLGVDHLMRNTTLSQLFYQLINRLLIDTKPLPTVR